MSDLDFTSTPSVVLPSFQSSPCLLAFAFLHYKFLTTNTGFFFFSLFLNSDDDSFVALDYSGILTTEFVSLLEETEFTIIIEAYPSPKVAWFKDGKAISGNYYVQTKTSHLEGNR